MAELVIADKRHKHRLPREVLEQMRRCLLIQMPAVGFDVIDHRAAAEFDIAVANSAGYNRDGVADWTVMAILNLVRRGSWGDRRMREGGWPKPEMLSHELSALTVGIPLRRMGNVFFSPHMAGFTLEAEARALDIVRDNLTRVLDGEEPFNVVNGVRLGARLRR